MRWKWVGRWLLVLGLGVFGCSSEGSNLAPDTQCFWDKRDPPATDACRPCADKACGNWEVNSCDDSPDPPAIPMYYEDRALNCAAVYCQSACFPNLPNQGISYCQEAEFCSMRVDWSPSKQAEVLLACPKVVDSCPSTSLLGCCQHEENYTQCFYEGSAMTRRECETSTGMWRTTVGLKP